MLRFLTKISEVQVGYLEGLRNFLSSQMFFQTFDALCSGKVELPRRNGGFTRLTGLPLASLGNGEGVNCPGDALLLLMNDEPWAPMELYRTDRIDDGFPGTRDIIISVVWFCPLAGLPCPLLCSTLYWLSRFRTDDLNCG